MITSSGFKPTHKGWFWFCPVYLSFDDPCGCAVEARHEWLEPLFDLADMFERARIWLTGAFDPDYEPAFMFKVTGEIRQ